MKKPCCICIVILVIVVVIAAGIGYAVLRSKNHAKSGDEGKYGDALTVSMQFLDVQKAGKLVNNKISWRGNSALKDGSELKVDLSTGLYDAGDHVKFGFPMAFTATILAWSILEYGESMKKVDQYQPAIDSLRWITDYLVNAHPKDDMLYVQVGDGDADHKCWERPETMSDKRPVSQINKTSPGTDVAAETAAALAAASLVFKKSDDSSYSEELLKHSKQLFSFADKYRGKYSASLPKVQKFYNSTGYMDELLWASAWLYHASSEKTYLEFVTGKAADDIDFDKPTWFSWDNKLPGTEVLLARSSFFDEEAKGNTDIERYKQAAEAIMCNVLPNSPKTTSSKTDGGLIWVTEWNSLQHPVAHAFLANLYGDYMKKSNTKTLDCDGEKFSYDDLRDFAKSQADYVLGENPAKMSYLVGYGDKFPQFVHHRGASIPADDKPSCNEGFRWLESDDPNPNEATGALVGGPYLNETYVDARSNVKQGEPTTYSCALAIALFSSLTTSIDVDKSLS
uniref:Endoglucanase n=1 Tax=Litchi chinensis TaxID=151069 RepID=A0A4P8P8I3_LITCN|nr:endo-(1,4)-beta-D-glucanase [Litchi chinensis]